VKILFDCRYVRFPRHDGISRFSAGLVTALAKIHPVTMIISDERQLAMLPDIPWVKTTSATGVTEPWVSRSLNQYEPDVVYTVMQTMGPFGRKFKLVSTVHDLIYYTNRTPPRNQPLPVRILWRLYHLSWAPQRALLKRADAHVAVSETTKKLMVDNHLTPHPISVVYNATETHLETERAAPVGLELVYMGSFMPYKNVEVLARGLHELPGYRLHLVSKADDKDRARLEQLAPAGSLVFHGGASDEEYLAILATAVALVTGSRNEGFGLPVIEAMAVGTPVVASDIPVFREIGGDAVVLFDENSPSAFAAAVKTLEEPATWRRASDRSREVARTFRWDESARRLLAFLRTVVTP